MAKVFGAQQARKGFDILWRLSGKPTLRVIEPVTAWTLPNGVSYDKHRDEFTDSQGNNVTVDWQSQPATTLAFLANNNPNSVDLQVPGMVTTEGYDVTVKWSAATQTAIAQAWGVSINDKLYRVRRWESIPAGVDSPTQIDVSLTEG